MICAKLGVSLFVARVANLQTSLVIIVVFINSAKWLQLTLKFHFILFCTKVGNRRVCHLDGHCQNQERWRSLWSIQLKSRGPVGREGEGNDRPEKWAWALSRFSAGSLLTSSLLAAGHWMAWWCRHSSYQMGAVLGLEGVLLGSHRVCKDRKNSKTPSTVGDLWQ